MGPELRGEKCGVFGVQGNDLNAARIVYNGLYALQHRGQEMTGIASQNDGRIHSHKGMGLVAHVYDEKHIDQLRGVAAIGHNRYSTSEGSTMSHAQPVIRREWSVTMTGWRPRISERFVALGHNGNLPSTTALKEFLTKKNVPHKGHNDSELMTDAIWYYMRKGATVEEAIRDAYPLFTGAFSLVVLTNDKLVAVRDPKGIRPLSIGKLNGAYIFSSETCALDTVHAETLGDVKPGEMVVVDEHGITRHQICQGQQKLEIFEYIYFARPDSMLLGQRVYEVRRRLGQELWKEHPVPHADVIVGVPDSALPAALGYAQASGIPYADGFIKNRYIHRTFIQPEQGLRDRGVALKLNPLSEVVQGKVVVLIDDSIVRGTNIIPLIRLLRQAGAKEVHVRITCPPYTHPDFYGIDTADQSKLIAARKTLGQIREHIGADSLRFLSLAATIRATQVPEEMLCTANFTGVYPIDIRERTKDVSRITFDDNDYA